MSFDAVSIDITKQLLGSSVPLLCSALSSAGLSPSALCHRARAFPVQSNTSWRMQTKLEHTTRSTSTARCWALSCGLSIFIIIIYHGSRSRSARSWPTHAPHPKVMLIMDSHLGSPLQPKVKLSLFCRQHDILCVFWRSKPASSSVGAALLQTHFFPANSGMFLFIRQNAWIYCV